MGESRRQGFAGGCYVNKTGICVTKPETYCDTATFVPTHYLRVNTGHPLRYCTYPGEMEKVIIGRCGGKHGKCSNLHSRCNDSSESDNNGGGGNGNGGDCDDDDCDGNRGGDGGNGNTNGNNNNNGNTDEEKEENQSSSFIEYDPTCTITQDLSSSSSTASSSLVSNTYVTYGKCNDRCVWSSDDCLPDEIYSLNDPTCTADKVQIGACFAGHAFCAVDASSCTQSNGNIPDEPYWSYQEVKEKIGTSCFLSSLPVLLPTPAQQPSSTVDSSIDETTTTSTVNSNLAMGGENLFSNTTTTPDGLHTGALVAIVTVVAIVVGAAIGILGAVRFNNSNNTRKDGTDGKHINDDEDDDDENALTADNLNTLIQQQQKMPIEDIEISMDDNENNNNNDDANSELSEENYHQIIMQQKTKQ